MESINSVIIIIRDKKGNFFVHQRNSLKKIFPNKFGIGAGGHIEKGESMEMAAKRELFEETKLKNNLKYLEVHNEKDGLKLFRAETRYDWYICQIKKVNNTETTIKFQDGTIKKMDVSKMEFIPNDNMDIIENLVSNNKYTVNVLYERTNYGTDKKWMSNAKSDEFDIPCVYTVRSNDELTYFYSSKENGNGIGIPKLIWSNGRISSVGSFIDKKGKYGLTQYAYAIVDKEENLEKIKKVFDSCKFRKLMESCAVGQLTINYKILRMFKRNFYELLK